MTNNAPLPLNGLRIFGYKSQKVQRFYLLKIAFHKCNLGCARNISCKLSSALAGTRFHRPSRACVFIFDKCLQVIREWA